MRIAWSWRLVLPLVLLMCVVTCYGPTEVRVSLSTDACQRNPRFAVYTGTDAASARAGESVAVSSAACDASSGLGNLVLVPSGEKNEHIVIVVLATFDGSEPTLCTDGSPQCVVARRSVRFSRHKSLDLPVLLSERCLNVACPNGPDGKAMTCVAGMCESAEVDDNPRLADPKPVPSNPPPDSSDPSDASVPDDSAAGVCTWGDGTHALGMAPKPVGGITSNSSGLFWVTAEGAIVHVPANGSSVTASADSDKPRRILVDEAARYLATTKYPLLERLKFNGVPEYIDAGVLSLAQDDSSVYAATANSVLRVTKGGTWEVPSSLIAAVPLDGPQSIAAGGTRLYWIGADHVSSVATSLIGPPVILNLVDSPIAIAADQTRAVIALSPKVGMGGIVEYTTGPPTPLVDGPGISDAALVMNEGAVYYTRKLSTGHELWRLENGKSTKLDQRPALRGLVVDTDCLYYWTGADPAATVGSIEKRSKR